VNANLLVHAFAAAGMASALLIGFPVAATPMKAKNETPDFGPSVIAGPVRSNVLLKVGKKNSYVGAPYDQTTLSDIFVRAAFGSSYNER